MAICRFQFYRFYGKYVLMKKSTILIVGGAGFIGAHVAKMLETQGYRTIVFDNLSTGSEEAVIQSPFIKGDIGNRKDLENVFSSEKIDAVMHFAALTDVGASVTNPADYYHNNVAYTLNLLDSMVKHGVNSLIFSSSAAIFGTPQQIPMDENHPCSPINPYGQTKLMVETLLKDYDHAYGLKSSCLRYFNAAGGDPDGAIKYKKSKDTNLIPLILRCIMQDTAISIYGTDYPTPDGTCIRDYIHIEDLGDAHIRAMTMLLNGGKSINFNLGNGNGFSVRDVIAAAERVVGRKIKTVEGPRRPGDPAILVADSKKAHRELGWQPKYPDLETMIAHAWNAR